MTAANEKVRKDNYGSTVIERLLADDPLTSRSTCLLIEDASFSIWINIVNFTITTCLYIPSRPTRKILICRYYRTVFFSWANSYEPIGANAMDASTIGMMKNMSSFFILFSS
jgi:hypothetical protein